MPSSQATSDGQRLNLIGANCVSHLSGGDAGSPGGLRVTSRRRFSSGPGNRAQGLDLWVIGDQRGRCFLLRPLRSRRGELGRNGLRMRYSPAPYPRRGNHREGNAAPNRGSARTQRPPSTKISRTQCRADNGPAERIGRRQGVSLARPVEEPRRRRVEDAHRRTQAAGLLTLARRRQGSCGGLCKPHPSGFGGRQASDAATGRNRRAVVRPQSRPRRNAADLAARTRKCSQTISGPRRRPQPRHPDAAADRGRNPERGGCTCAGLSVFRRHREGRRDHLLSPRPATGLPSWS